MDGGSEPGHFILASAWKREYVYKDGLFQYAANRCYNISNDAIAHETAPPTQEWSANQKWRQIFGTAFPSTIRQ
jgi:hypothetical protein